MPPMRLRGCAMALLCLQCAFGAPALGSEQYELRIDPGLLGTQPSLRSDTSARNLSSLLRSASWAGGAVLDATELETSTHPIFARSLLAALFDFPLALYAGWFQHEVFGHLPACRQLYGVTCNFSIAIPPPYGFHPHLNEVELGGLLEGQGQGLTAFYLSGREAQQQLSDELTQAAMASGGWNRLGSAALMTSWAERVWETLRPSEQRDVGRYYHHLTEIDPGWSRARTRARVLSGVLMLLDPVAWFASIAYAQQLIHGAPLIGLPDVLPGPLVGLVRPRVTELPHGPEWGLQFFLASGGDVYSLTATAGLQPSAWSATLSAEAPLPRPLPQLALSVEAHLWYRANVFFIDEEGEPPLWLKTPPQTGAPRTLVDYYPGYALQLEATWWFLPTVGASARLGIKSRGFLIGGPPWDVPYGEVGLTIAPR